MYISGNCVRLHTIQSPPLTMKFSMARLTVFTVLVLLSLCCSLTVGRHRHIDGHSARASSSSSSPSSAALAHGWHVATSHPASPSTSHILRFALRQRRLDELEAYVNSVSNPQSSTYGKYLTLAEVAEYVAPSPADVEAFRKHMFLIGADQVTITESQDFAYVRLSLAAIGRIVKNAADESPIELFEHHHITSGRRVLRVKRGVKYTLVPELHSFVELVTGLGDFFEMPSEIAARKSVVQKHQQQRQATSPNPSSTPRRRLFEADSPLISAGPSPADCASSSPDLIITGGHDSVSIRAFIYCQNGKPTSDRTTPCSDYPPVATQFSVTLTPIDRLDVRTFSYPLSKLRKTNYGDKVIANFPGMDIEPYETLNVTAQVTYADGTLSAVGVYGTGVYAPTPFLTPQFIQEHYNIPVGTKGIMKENSQATLAFEEIFLSLDDLDLFQAANGLKSEHPTIYGWNDPTKPGSESALDIEWIMGVAPGVHTTFMQISGNGTEGSKGPAVPPGDGAFLLEWAMQVNNMKHPPLVTSLSYGDTEVGYYNKFGSWSYVNRLEVELMKMAARGLTVIVSCGDAGVSNVGMYGNDISEATHTCTPFLPEYPGSSRWVTAVGGTYITNLASPICDGLHHLRPELPISCQQLGEAAISVRAGLTWTTGGGFSNRTGANAGTGWWQQDVVQQYIKTQSATLPPSALWNRGGRAYPDVALLGFNFPTFIGGSISSVGGTSASSPVFGALISLMNDYRLREGQPPLGFLNPFLYLASSIEGGSFRDVTMGQNNDGEWAFDKCYFIDPATCPYGFTASPGWDPVTGLGSPNWQVLKDLALSFGEKATRHH